MLLFREILFFLFAGRVSCTSDVVRPYSYWLSPTGPLPCYTSYVGPRVPIRQARSPQLPSPTANSISTFASPNPSRINANGTVLGGGGGASSARLQKKIASIEGDLVLGGLMMVHERGEDTPCGPIMPQGGVQALETMLYTIDVVNSWKDFLPGITIGAHVLDDCDRDTYGLEQAVDFIKGSISNIDDGDYRCPDGSTPNVQHKVISGVVGAASSVTSIQVANLLRLFRIPQVSYFSTSPELSNKQRFEYFSRTIPSDRYQVQAMVELVMKLRWTYISIIYEESNYGNKAFEELESQLGNQGVCIAVREKLVKDSGVAQEHAYDAIVLRLQAKPRAKGVIVFGSDQEVAALMRAVRRCNATSSFYWIGSDGWSSRSLVSDHNELEVEGTLSVQPQANPVRGFDSYFLGLHPLNNTRNPWFTEFWEDHFNCRLPMPSSFHTPSPSPSPVKYCSGEEQLTYENTQFEAQLQFVSDAVMAFAYALRSMHQEVCNGYPGICEKMKPVDGADLLTYLRRVRFDGLSGDQFHFNDQGDAPARYNIIHFRQERPGYYRWVRVGTYNEGELHIDMKEVQFRYGHSNIPESVCSFPCERGQAKKYVEEEGCCWHCFNCSLYQIQDPADETQCFTCPLGTLPNSYHEECVEIPEQYLRIDSGWAIGAMIFGASGVLMTTLVLCVFLTHNSTAVVRASGRELSYVLLVGLLLCYALTFLFVLKPNDLVCGFQKFSTGFCFTVVYAALLTKTNRIARIFQAGRHSAKRPSFISPRSQLVICTALVFIQVIINGLWLFVSPPRATHMYPTREDNILVCASSTNTSYMIAFAYPIVLVLICTIYAVLTRKIPEAFNESQHIGFTMYTTCVIWLAFVPIYFSTANHVALRVTSMSVAMSLSATVALACLFAPKVYIIMFHPERNIRQSMMPARPLRTAPHTLTSLTSATTASMSARVDSSTQSEAADYELLDALRPLVAVSRSTSATQTPTLGCDGAGDSASRPDSPSLSSSPVTHARVPCNGPLQDVPDVQL